jgi:hypothetical protein
LGKFFDEKMHKILLKKLLKLPIDKNSGAQDRAPASEKREISFKTYPINSHHSWIDNTLIPFS